MSSYEFSEWQAFDRIEPLGEQRADLRAAIIAWVINNAMSMGKSTATIEDFMPKFAQEDPNQKMLSTVEALNARYGGRDLRDTPKDSDE